MTNIASLGIWFALFAASANAAWFEDVNIGCPGSPAWVYAWAQIHITSDLSCESAKAEVLARVAGSQSGAWTDPHNGGTYSERTLPDRHNGGTSVAELLRVTGNGEYTDFIDIAFTDFGGGCQITGCRFVGWPRCRSS